MITQEGFQTDLQSTKRGFDDKSPRTPEPQPGQVDVCESTPLAEYAKLCRVTGAPEEVLIAFALLTHQDGRRCDRC